jgi:hypothetical protein
MTELVNHLTYVELRLALDSLSCTTDRIRMTPATGTTEIWQARIGRDLAAQLRHDAAVLGLDGRTEIVKAALELLHRRAAEERMARSVEEFYGDTPPPLPIGVRQQQPNPTRGDVSA